MKNIIKKIKKQNALVGWILELEEKAGNYDRVNLIIGNFLWHNPKREAKEKMKRKRKRNGKRLCGGLRINSKNKG